MGSQVYKKRLKAGWRQPKEFPTLQEALTELCEADPEIGA